MTTKHTWWIIGAAITAVFALIVVIVFWTQHHNEPEPYQEAVLEPTPEGPHDYEDLALEAAEIMTTWHPSDDFNRTASEIRARHLMTDKLADSIEAPERPASGAEWIDAAQHEAVSRPTVEINRYTETETGVISVFATWEWVTPEGTVEPNEDDERIYYFAFNNHGKIVDYTYETIPQHEESENGK